MVRDQRGGREELGPNELDLSSRSHTARPEVGLRSQFATAPRTSEYLYDPSLDPTLSWDARAARDRAETLLVDIKALAAAASKPGLDDQARAETLRQLESATADLQGMSRPLLNWTGKAERQRLDLPVLPLFIHERLSGQAVLATVQRLETDRRAASGAAGPSTGGAVVRSYEHPALWANRLIAGDSLLVMNSLLDHEGMGGQIQTIYMEPPYGVGFHSSQPESEHRRGADPYSGRDPAREPERVRAYRETWELGIHSYLTHLRDRLALCRSLLAPSGSLFVRTSHEYEHHVGELLDEVFGAMNRVAIITVRNSGKRSGGSDNLLPTRTDFVLWYAKDRGEVKYRPLYRQRGSDGRSRGYTGLELPDGTRRMMTAQEAGEPLPPGARLYRLDSLTAPGRRPNAAGPFEIDGRTFHPGPDAHWIVDLDGLARLAEAGRLEATATGLHFVRYVDDAPSQPLDNAWWDLAGLSDAPGGVDVVQRCLLMTTDPGDVVFDPTCGEGTTPLVAEHWGRRWLAADVSRVALALARQRLLTATFPWWQLRDPVRGPAGGFVYSRRQNAEGQEVGGLVPRHSLHQLAHGAAPDWQVRVDHPDRDASVIRASGPLTVEAVMPPALSPKATAVGGNGTVHDADPRLARILEALRGVSVLTVPGGEQVTLRRVRAVGRSDFLHAEADAGTGSNTTLAAFIVGPHEAPVTECLVRDAAQEASRRGYGVLYIIGFALEDEASRLLYRDVPLLPLPVVYVQASADLLMGDFLPAAGGPTLSVIGAPDIRVTTVPAIGGSTTWYRVELMGLDVFDPMAGAAAHGAAADVPCWMLDSNYDERAFNATQVFFPRTHARAHLRKTLGDRCDDWGREHLGSTVSAPFAPGAYRRIAVKVIDDRGNELLLSRGLTPPNDAL